MLKCRIASDSQAFDHLADAWNRLLLRSEFVTVFGTAGFSRAWWKAYGTGRTLRLVVVEDEAGTIRLIAPFYSDAATPDVWKLVGNFRADYNNIIMAAGDGASLSCLFDWLYKQRAWNTIVIDKVPEPAAIMDHFPVAYGPESSSRRKLRSWAAIGQPLVYRTRQMEHPQIDSTRLRELRNLADYRSYGGQSYRRHFAWFGRQGAVEYASISDCTAIRSLLPAFMQMHIDEWASKGGSSFFLKPENRVFYEYLTEEMTAYDALRLDTLTVGGRMVAAHFGFTWRRRVYYYKPCYDPTVGNHGPGRLLFAQMLQRAADEDAEEFDLLFGSEAYKMQFALHVRPTGSLLIQRSRLRCLATRVTSRMNRESGLPRAS